MSRTADDNTTGKKDLANADAASGPTVTNAQREINSLNSFTGRTAGSVYNVDPAWTNNDVGSATDSLFDRVNTITGEFDNTTGHTHDGTDGNGGTINASNLSGLNYFRAVRQVAIVASGTSATKNVTTEFTGKVADGNATTAGVVTDAPKNKAYLIQASDGTAPIDGSGNIVYSRITESGGTWTLSFYVLLSGVETAYSFPSDQSLQVYFTEVFNLSSVPTFNEDAGLVETGSFVADVPDATTSIRGLISTVAQSFAGDKTFTDALNLAAELSLAQANDTSSGSSVTLSLPATTIARLTNASLVSIEGVTAPSTVRMIGLFNATTVDVIIQNDSAATAVDGILTGTGTDFTFKNTSAILLIYDTATQRWRIIGGGAGGTSGGSGSGGINYIENPDAETDTAGWATFADAAASRPVDGTGGSPTVTWTRSTSSPLRDTANFLFTKDAANRQGEGVSYDFTIDSADQARVLQISFDYQIGSGTYSGGTSSTDSDLIAYIYRTTATGRLIEPSVIKLDGGVVGVNYSYRGEFQADADATGYRLIIYCATTSASAYTVKFDNFIVGPSKNVNGSITTSPVSYTPTLTTSGGGNITLNATAKTDPNGWWYRDGEFLHGQVSFRNGSGGGATGSAGTVRVGLPSGHVPNTAKMATAVASLRKDGDASLGVTTDIEATVIVDAAGYCTIYFQGGTNLLAVSDLVANYIVVLNFRYPVVGWGATATLGQDADTRVVSLRVGTSGAPTGTIASSFGSSTTIQFNSVTNDTSGGYAAATGYTVPVAGWYQIHGQQAISHASVAVNQEATMGLYVNGTLTSTGPTVKFQSTGVVVYYPYMDDTRFLKAGDIVTVRIVSTGTTPVTAADSNGNNLIINRISGPAQVAAPVIVAFSAAPSAPTATIISTYSDVTSWGTPVVNTLGATLSSGVYTVPAAGIYKISAQAMMNATYALGNTVGISIVLDGSTSIAEDLDIAAGAESTITVQAQTMRSLISGQTLKVQVRNAGTTPTFASGTDRHHFIIERIGGIG